MYNNQYLIARTWTFQAALFPLLQSQFINHAIFRFGIVASTQKGFHDSQCHVFKRANFVAHFGEQEKNGLMKLPDVKILCTCRCERSYKGFFLAKTWKCCCCCCVYHLATRWYARQGRQGPCIPANIRWLSRLSNPTHLMEPALFPHSPRMGDASIWPRGLAATTQPRAAFFRVLSICRGTRLGAMHELVEQHNYKGLQWEDLSEIYHRY